MRGIGGESGHEDLGGPERVGTGRYSRSQNQPATRRQTLRSSPASPVRWAPGTTDGHGRQLRQLVAVAVGGLLALTGGITSSAVATGGETIASAPTIPFGELQTGGGKSREFFRLQLFGGDRVTFRWAKSPGGRDQYIHLFDPSIDDFRLSSAEPLLTRWVEDGKSEFTMDAPFTGLGVLEACQAGGYVCDQEDEFQGAVSVAYSFTALVAHKTALSVSGLPRFARPGQRLVISARVQSPAGAPAGECLFTPTGSARGRVIGPVALAGGRCRATVRAPRRGSFRYRVRYEPEESWLADTVNTRRVRVRRG